MKHYHSPTKELNYAVESIWIQDSDMPSQEIFYPSLHTEMIFNLGKEFTLLNPRNEAFSYHLNGSINGINTCVTRKNWQQGHSALVIKFRPWGFFSLFGWEAISFYQKIVHAEPYFNKKILSFSKQLIHSSSIEEKFTLLDEFLLSNSLLQDIPKELCSFLEDMQDVSTIREYLKSKRIPHTTFNTLFKKVMGIGAKQYILISRLENAIDDIRKEKSKSLTEIAYKHGFYDQAHFTKTFYFYTHMTPSQFKNTLNH